MKNVFKFLMIGAVAAGTALTGFAQDPAADQQAVYQKFLDNRKCVEPVNLDKCRVAIAAGDEYLQKYGADEANKAIVDYLNKQLPPLKKFVETTAVSQRFNAAVPAKNWDEAFASGKELLAQNPDNIDVMLILASIGFDNAIAAPPIDKYNADTVNLAKTAIQKLNEGKPSLTGNYGAFVYNYKTPEFADGKNNALGVMNYTVGYIMFNRLNQKKEALPYLYKATQANSATKSLPEIYRLIGSYYLDEYNKIVADRKAKIDANNGEETDETKASLGLQYAYAERAIDAYARAYKVGAKESEAYKKSLTNIARQVYNARFGNETGADAYIAAAPNKPFVDPATDVTPVVVETTTPAVGTPATTGTPAATNPAMTAKPATASMTPPAAATPAAKKPKQ